MSKPVKRVSRQSASFTHLNPYLVHLWYNEVLVVSRTSRNCSLRDIHEQVCDVYPTSVPYRERVWSGVSLLGRIAVESRTKRRDEVCKALTLCSVARVLKVEIQTIQTIVLEQLECAVDEGLALGCVSDEAEVTTL